MAGDGKMIEDVKRRLTETMERPLTLSGSEELARSALLQFPVTEPPLLDHFAGKILETAADGLRHDTLAVPPGGGVAVWFVVWPGTHDEAVPLRHGEYLDQLYGKARLLVDAGIPLQGFLEIDAYVFEDDGRVDPADGAPALEVEYSFLPGPLIGGVAGDDQRWNIIVVNLDLCTPEERQALAKFMA